MKLKKPGFFSLKVCKYCTYFLMKPRAIIETFCFIGYSQIFLTRVKYQFIRCNDHCFFVVGFFLLRAIPRLF